MKLVAMVSKDGLVLIDLDTRKQVEFFSGDIIYLAALAEAINGVTVEHRGEKN